jgi:hypothetical protein
MLRSSRSETKHLALLGCQFVAAWAKTGEMFSQSVETAAHWSKLGLFQRQCANSGQLNHLTKAFATPTAAFIPLTTPISATVSFVAGH